MPKGKMPTYKGKVCDDSRQEFGTIALWLQDKSELKSEKSPILRGEIELETAMLKEMSSFDELKIKLRIALWPNGKVEVKSG